MRHPSDDFVRKESVLGSWHAQGGIEVSIGIRNKKYFQSPGGAMVPHTMQPKAKSGRSRPVSPDALRNDKATALDPGSWLAVRDPGFAGQSSGSWCAGCVACQGIDGR